MDPRPEAEVAPYTYFLPSENELLALEQGDQVKIIIRSIPESLVWDAERMWFTIIAADGERLVGELDNEPSDIPQIRPGLAVSFNRTDVIDILWNPERRASPPSSPGRREYWARCLVDACLIQEHLPAHFLYREEPELAQGDDKYPDSGWRIRADYRGLTDEEIDAREMQYVALGVPLNCDDSWLHLIDEPIGSAYIRDWETGKFIAYQD
nr:DUF2185 domain-containing protein [Sphingobium subterraneum]